MNLNIKITGPAGLGINSTSDVIINIFGNLGYNVISDIEYESRIKGGVNFFQIFISDNGPFLTKFSDVILAFNLESLEKNILSLKENGIIFVNEKIKNSFNKNIENIIQEKKLKVISTEINDKYDNTYLLALFSYYFQIDINIVKDSFKEIFLKKGQEIIENNNLIIDNVILNSSFEKNIFKIKKNGEKKCITYGNKIIAQGGLDGGLEYYSAYPMTPASSILTEIIASKKVSYLQAEDEIAVINSALGASFSGARSMVGTSGGGFALMSEALSFAIQAEIPITVILSQRAGPSTGTPTYHETGDINFALNPTFGDFNHIVLSPSNLEEAYYFAGLSLNLADKYQSIVILLIDKQFSELIGTIGELKKVKIDRGVILANPPSDYKRYEFNESGISPRVIVGTKNGDFIASSYEHDEYGATSEDFENKKLMTEKRFKKLENFFKKEGINGFEVFPLSQESSFKTSPQPSPLEERGRGVLKGIKKIIITFSATSYTAKEFVKNNPEYALIIIKFLKPLDERLLDILKDKQEIIFVESNYSGQLENYICNHFGLKFIKGLKISNIRKYDLFPFYIEDFEEIKNKN